MFPLKSDHDFMLAEMSKLVTPRLVAVCVCVNERAGRVQVGTCSWRLLLTRFELCSEIRKCDVCVSTLDQLVFPVHLFPKWGQGGNTNKSCYCPTRTHVSLVSSDKLSDCSASRSIEG